MKPSIRVLYVENNPSFAQLVADFLEQTDEEIGVVTEPTTAGGLNLLREDEFDCIVSDYDLPGKNGVEFLELVRDKYPDLPFILYTGKGSEEVASEAISKGATDYLQKRGGTEQYQLLANRVCNAVEQYRSNKEAKQTRRRVQNLAESTSHCVWMFAHDWEEVLFISGYEEVWDRPTQAIRENPHDFLNGVHPEDRSFVREAMERMSNGEPIDIEYRILRGDDEPGWVWVRGEPVFDDDGTVESVVGYTRDITERKRREQELRRYKRAMDEAPVGVTITDPDREDNPVIYANRQFRELTGYAEEEIRGRNCRFLQGESTDPDSVATMRNAIENEERVSVELRNYRKDGTEFWNRVSIAPVRDADGAVVNYVGFQQDLTDRREQEQEREATIEFLQRLYDVATDRSLAVNEKITRLLEIGPEHLNLPSGYLTRITSEETPETMTQRVIEASGDHELLQPGNSCPLSQSYCRKTIETDDVVAIHDALAAGWEDDPAYELFNLGCYIGTTITVDDDLYGTVFLASEAPREEPFTDAERTFVRLMGRLVSYELERDHARRELEQQNERLEEFANIVSHDLRNPLGVAEGRLELAREECNSEHLDGIDDALTRCQALIDDLLTLAREGNDARETEPVDLGPLVETCWQNVATAEASIVRETERTIKADRSRLQQLLENLFRNAVEHGGDGVTVTIGDLTNGFYIQDDGTGIPPDKRDTVFDAGYSTTDKGTGFGLSIVKRIVEAHEWKIHVTEGSEGGARFEITGVELAAE